MIIMPRFVSLDTATLSKLAKDFFSGDPTKTSTVKAIRDKLRDTGWFVTLTSDHILELAQHANRDIVFSRFKFLRTFESLAWIWDIEKTGLGGFLDIDCFEIQSFLEEKIETTDSFVRKFREQMLVVGSGDQLFGDRYDEWMELAAAAKPGARKSQAAVSILRTDPVKGINDMTLRAFLGVEYDEDAASWSRKAEKLARKMAQQIDAHGDDRVTNSSELAHDFYAETVFQLGEFQDKKPNTKDQKMAFIESLLRCYEIPTAEVNLAMTVGEIGDLGHFSEMLKIYGRKLGRSQRLTISDVKPSNLPSWRLRLQLRNIQNQAKRVRGSDFGDRYLACLSPYLDSCEVDKRTNDYLRRIMDSKTNRIDFLNHWFKCSDYRDIDKLLPESSASAD